MTQGGGYTRGGARRSAVVVPFLPVPFLPASDVEGVMALTASRADAAGPA